MRERTTSDVADDINGSTVSGGRASMLFKPSESFSLQLTAFIQDIDNDASSGVDSDYATGETLYGGLTQSQFVPEAADISYRVYNATATWDLGFGDLTSATSYGENTQDFRQDITMLLGGLESYIEQTTSVERITQELRLASHENEKVDWLIGAYYNDEDGLIYQNVHVVEPGTLTDIPHLPGRRHGRLEVQGVRGVRERDHQVHAELRSHARRPLQQQRPGRGAECGRTAVRRGGAHRHLQ